MAYTLDLSGRVAFITGASSGLGAQFAKTLAAAGAAVVLASRRVEMLKALRAEIEAEGGDAHVVALDVTNVGSIEAALNFAEKATMVAKAGEGGGYASMTYIVAGTASGLSAPCPSSGTSYSLETYCFRGGRLIHQHSTDVEDVPLCMVEFQDKLLVGVGRSLRLYDMGRKRLLRKCELRGFPNHITKLAVSGGRVFVGDVTNSVTFVKYDRMDNTLKVFAEERRPR